MMSYEYKSFINQKVLEYLPHDKIRVGDKWNFRCPLCHDSKKSATKRRGWWYERTASYFCFNCSTGMSGIKFLEAISGSGYDEIKHEYLRLFAKSKQDFNLSAAYEVPNEEPNLFSLRPLVKPEWKHELSLAAREYLDNRLVSKAPFFNNHIFSWYSKKNAEYILIPWTLNGIDAYYQLNDFQKHGSMKYIFPRSEKKIVAGLDNVDVSWPYVIVFEGYYDSLFVKNGICSGTKAITDYQLKIIKERYPRHEICISFDNDESGIDSMIKMIKKDCNFKFFRWFNEETKAKDINDYIKANGNVNTFANQDDLQTMIQDKLAMKMWLIKTGNWR